MIQAPDGFPRRYAQTQRFTAGTPRTFRVAADGSKVAFLRSDAGDDPVHHLWILDLAGGSELKLVDTRELLSESTDGDLPAAEQARRERARESGQGIVTYDVDGGLSRATFALGGQLFWSDVLLGATEPLSTAAGAFDPRLSPDGWLVAYVSDRSVRATSPTTNDFEIVSSTHPSLSWGAAEFIAAEEMGRTRGYWWGPDGERLLVQHTDVSMVDLWHIASPVDPAASPAEIRYPAAGTDNARVGLAVIGVDGSRRHISIHRGEFEYLVSAGWAPNELPTFTAQTRDQKTLAVFVVDPDTGSAREVHRETDEHWVDVVPGTPGWADGRLVTAAMVTPPGQWLRRVVDIGAEHAIVVATDEPTEAHVWRVDYEGEAERLTSAPGVHDAAAGGDVVVITSATLDEPGATVRVLRGEDEVARIRSVAARPSLRPSVHLLRSGADELRTAVLLPSDHDGETRLPVLMDPYGGPHALRVVLAHNAFLVPQWFADNGFAVVVADGRGTPGRGPEWERAVRGDLAEPVLDDQITALRAAADAHPFLDLDRVAMRGWSFGGYLAALAVLRRPDVFHAAIAGAPVSDWRLYDTHYTERYLGHPDEEPENYERTDLTAGVAGLERPLLLIHGLADDNVVAAHTLRLSRALLEAGSPHQVLPLSGVTHMTPQEVVAEHLLRFQLAFLQESL